MNVKEAAEQLFVSRAHVRRLLERGQITGTATEQGDYTIDGASVQRYANERSRATKAYLRSQNEDNDPLGL